jgi:transposase-like protein
LLVFSRHACLPNLCVFPNGQNGRIHNGKQRFKCDECRRQFVEHPQKKAIDSATRELIDRLLLERISLAGIARATQVSEQWLQTYVNQKYAQVPRKIQVAPKKGD